MTAIGDRIDVELERPAHGGLTVGRVDGQVVFARFGLPGERVRAEVTRIGPKGRFLNADVVEVLGEPSLDRVDAPCPYYEVCGGCDLQHVSATGQLEFKGAVVAEQLERLGGVSVPVTVEPLAGDGFGWRTRVELAVDGEGRAGFLRHRSHDVVATDDCLIAHPAMNLPELLGRRWPARARVEVAVSESTGRRAILVKTGGSGRSKWVSHEATELVERVGDVDFQVSAGGFWQVHPEAPRVLTEAVLAAAEPRPGETVFDLYAGVGLFARAFAAAVGESGAVFAVEGARSAERDLAVNLGGVPGAEFWIADVETALEVTARRPDLIVCDPPRAGVGAGLVERMTGMGARVIVYVACDPASLGRDTRAMSEHGYDLVGARSFDLFPQTHHVETVAVFGRKG